MGDLRRQLILDSVPWVGYAAGQCWVFGRMLCLRIDGLEGCESGDGGLDGT